jgi:hypothetical protein
LELIWFTSSGEIVTLSADDVRGIMDLALPLAADGLRSLMLRCNGTVTYQLPALASRLRDGGTRLASLQVFGFDVSAGALAQLPGLRSLFLARCGGAVISAALHAMRAAPELSELLFNLCKIELVSGSGGAAAMPAGQLRKLTIRRCGEGAAELMAQFGLSALRELRLDAPLNAQNCVMRDASALFSAMRPMPALDELVLTGCDLSTTTWAAAPKFAPRLRSVVIFKPRVGSYLFKGEVRRTPEEWEELRTATEAVLHHGGLARCVVELQEEAVKRCWDMMEGDGRV